MELTENTAAKWEQIRNETAELASSIASKQEIIKSISSALDELITDFDAKRETLEKLRDLADKEMLREESGTLNDETPAISKPQPRQTNPAPKEKQVKSATKNPARKKRAKSNTKKTGKASDKTSGQPELPMTENTKDSQPDRQESKK